MQLVQKFNTYKNCIQATCDSKYTHFCEVDFYGMKIMLTFCEKHAEEFETKVARALQVMENKMIPFRAK